jgi:hypothetical protein
MIREGRDIPHQFLALLAAVAVDSVEYRSYRARTVPVRFESFNDAYDMSLFLWANVNREERCSICRKHFEYTEHFQHVFSVALDSENNIKFLHRLCADTNSRTLDVIIEGWNWSDVMHTLSVPWRGMEERAVIGDTARLEDVTTEELLQAQNRTQDTAEYAALKAEQQRRAQLRVIQ